MISPGSSDWFTSAGILSAIAASLCCVAPVIALFAGSSSFAANFEGVEPIRPYLIGLSLAAISIAWYLKLNSSYRDVNCNCVTTDKTPVRQSKRFLGAVTFFAVVMMTFPLYTEIFYPKKNVPAVSTLNIPKRQEIKFSIQGMTCAACAALVNNELANVDGVLAYQTLHDAGNSLVSFDASKVGIRDIEIVINKTGYQVTGHHVADASFSQGLNSFWFQTPDLTYSNDRK